MAFRKIEDAAGPEPDEDIVAEIESSWAKWYIASLSAVLTVIVISVLSLAR